MCYLFLAALTILFLSPIVISLTMIYLGMSFGGFILSSWICKFMIFTKLGDFQSFLSNIFYYIVFFLLFFWPPVANTRSFGFVPLISEVLFILFPMLCFFLCSDGMIFVVNLQIHWLFPVSSPFCDWIHSVASLFYLLCLQIFVYLLMWLCWVLVVTQEIFAVSCGIFHCGTWTVPCSSAHFACW